MRSRGRRKFLIAAGALLVAPVAGGAQQQANPVVGFLYWGSPDKTAFIVAAVRQGLKEARYVEGQNVTILYRWANGDYDRMPALAADLVQRRVDVILAGGNFAAQVAKKATTTMAVVFTSGADPVRSGLVASLSRPGANLTGASIIAQEMGAKRLELMRRLLPQLRTVAMIINPKFAGAEAEMQEVQAAARSMGLQALRLAASNNGEIDSAFATIGRQRVDGVMVGTDGYLITRRDQFAELAVRYTMPTMYPFPAFPTAGGLISYGPSLADGYR